MGKRTEYAPGTFCWVELAAKDAQATAKFYSSVFDWDIDASNMGSMNYLTAQVNGDAVAGIYESQQPTPWLTYVSVENVEVSAKTAEQLGGQIVAEVTDVEPLGRMAVVQDPNGAVFAIWQPGSMAGAELVNDPGAFCLTQLNTSDPEAASAFYAGLFDWEIEKQPGDTAYWGMNVNGNLNAGMMPNPSPGPDHWLTYFTVTSVRDTVTRIQKAKGKIVMPETALDFGLIAVAQDPSGNLFCLFEGRVDD